MKINAPRNYMLLLKLLITKETIITSHRVLHITDLVKSSIQSLTKYL